MSDLAQGPIGPSFHTDTDFMQTLIQRHSDLTHSEFNYLLGQLLTLVDSLFDEGKRAEAVKDSLRNIFWKWRDEYKNRTESILVSVAAAIGDKGAVNHLKQMSLHKFFWNLPALEVQPRIDLEEDMEELPK